LISAQINPNDIDLIIDKLSKNVEVNSMYKVIVNIFLKLKINEHWSSEFFVKIYNILIDEKDVDLDIIENIEIYLKFANESKMTTMKSLQLSSTT
jgi:hypothetical protein